MQSPPPHRWRHKRLKMPGAPKIMTLCSSRVTQGNAAGGYVPCTLKPYWDLVKHEAAREKATARVRKSMSKCLEKTALNFEAVFNNLIVPRHPAASTETDEGVSTHCTSNMATPIDGANFARQYSNPPLSGVWQVLACWRATSPCWRAAPMCDPPHLVFSYHMEYFTRDNSTVIEIS